jgi:ankyrin repeat protein
MSSRFHRTLPARPDLAQQKKQAKELLRSYDAGDPEAHERIRAELPDKPEIALADAQFVLAREYAFTDWASLARHIEASAESTRSPVERIHAAIERRDFVKVRRLFEEHPSLRQFINQPIFSFNSPPIVAFANDAEMVNVLLDFGADPNARSTWWAGGFHALYSATGAAAERLLAAGAVPDACAAAHLGRVDLLESMIAKDPAVVHLRGGDGQTPLHFATSRAVIDLLLDAGADIDARDVDHRSTPAEWMMSPGGDGRTELARYLVERGATADIFLAAALGLGTRVREMLQADPTQLDWRIGEGAYGEKPPSSYHIYFWTIGSGRSPMDVAAQYGQQDVLAAMRKVASPRQRLLSACRIGDKDEVDALLRAQPGILATLQPHDHCLAADAAWAGNVRALTLMLELGFDPRVQRHDAGTALHCAAWQGSVECVAVLLARADARELLEILDTQFHATPLGWCMHGSLHGPTHRDHARIARMLLDAGANADMGDREASPAVEAALRAWRRS